jgi:hypothetical protein
MPGWAYSDKCIYFFKFLGGAVRLSPLVTSANIGLLYQPTTTTMMMMMMMMMCGAVGGMRIGRGTEALGEYLQQ